MDFFRAVRLCISFSAFHNIFCSFKKPPNVIRGAVDVVKKIERSDNITKKFVKVWMTLERESSEGRIRPLTI